MEKVRNTTDVAVRQDSSGAVQKQTTATVHSQPAMTSTPFPVTSPQVPMTSHQRNSVAAGVGQSFSQLSATTADSTTFSRTTLYAFLSVCSYCCEY